MQRQEVFTKVSGLLTDFLRLKPGEVSEASHVVRDLGADSLAIVELGFKFMETFGIGMIAADDENLVVARLVDRIVELMKA
jgi:acyl carrier protein